MNRTLGSLLLVVASLMLHERGTCIAADQVASGGRALLVGCTKYDHLAPAFQLQGGINDVELMRHVLRDRFHFPPDRIVVLSEAEGHQNSRPTRANIVRELECLGRDAKPHELVVIYLAGHGSQQPDVNPSPDDPEPDGKDELFLPADVKGWDGGIGRVANAIIDDELGVWLKEIEKRQAAVTIIVDACHSGTMTRNLGETPRQVPEGVLIPAEVMTPLESKSFRHAASIFGEKTRGMSLQDSFVDSPSILALYAAQPSEITVERLMPSEGNERKPHGLLTYTICQILSRSTEPLTYRELVRRIHAQYSGMGRTAPTPVVEGRDLDRRVFGLESTLERSAIQLTKSRRGLSIDAGRLHGITNNSILAVFDADDPSPKEPIGFVRVQKADVINSDVVPVGFNAKPTSFGLPPRSRCELITIDPNDFSMEIALVSDRDVGERGESMTAVSQALADLLKTDPSLQTIRLVDKPESASWLVFVGGDGVRLIRSNQYRQDASSSLEHIRSEMMGPYPIDGQLQNRLGESLSRIERSTRLKRLATEDQLATASEAGRQRCQVDVVLTTGDHKKVVEDNPQFHDGDRVSIAVANKNPYAIDISMLYIDGNLLIAALFPRENEYNRLQPGEIRRISTRIVCNRRTIEHLVVIAVKSESTPINFNQLASPSPSLPKRRSISQSEFNNGLNDLINGSLSTRSNLKTVSRVLGLRLFSWELIP